ncbi:hipa protein [Candidatus Burkholderia verschuerenii]|uniref:Hipa protein n=1 Tax=Candidatus Burkholderia verschuerenii TaxID=242163 RepID=A0A0L0MG09_9BURK|nr:type II toxin-antitoxin system HipA family toxin [Candidatus Burkholderia verschuerenii]KND61263.1 hipa protein [Candidatus Burkholderia verschuerenii]
MAEKERPVWVWLPGETAPVLCGTFGWSPRLGEFSYSDAYRTRADALPIDPINLPFSRARRPATTTNMNGVFGVLRDAAPEGFGLDLLLAIHEKETLDEVERMDLAPGDGVGALEVCLPEHIERKVDFKPPAFQLLKAGLENVDPGYSARSVVQSLSGADDTTSLGGEKPKLTVSLKADNATAWWIAKLQERGGSPFLPAREFVAMTLARMCGLEAADVRYERVGPHELVLVRRFDRKVVDSGVHRSLFASTATVLRLRSDQTPEDADRSYVKLAYELQRWCGDRSQSFAEQQRELWRRMAFNALVGNYDDHPRNHGLLYRNGSWTLAPAYDVVAFPRRRGVQAMAVNRKGERTATPENLVVDAPSFSLTVSEAWDTLQAMAHTVHSSWRQLYVDACGMSEENLEGQRPAFELAEQIATGASGLDPSAVGRRSRRGAR